MIEFLVSYFRRVGRKRVIASLLGNLLVAVLQRIGKRLAEARRADQEERRSGALIFLISIEQDIRYAHAGCFFIQNYQKNQSF